MLGVSRMKGSTMEVSTEDKYLEAVRDKLVAEAASDKAWLAVDAANARADAAERERDWWRLCACVGWACATVAAIVVIRLAVLR